MGSEVSTGAGWTGRGQTQRQTERRQAILDGAFAVFARRGYAQACVQEIAGEAGVAKPTVYSHLADKESLYREAVEAVAERVGARAVAAVEPLRSAATADAADLRAALTSAAHALLLAICCQESRAVRQLACAQAVQFPGLAAAVRERVLLRPHTALADRLTRLVLSGRLRPCDPDRATEHLLALLTGPLEHRPDADVREVAAEAVDVFLRAYGA
ncbi:TetR/AcrR family transcriptional regulator [Kitasatospora sp. NPDC127067]|uniref:TetR/AcrR family transcriptional regulator n=1 Tax=Kitasatospora sp. NPDC127067 TaxID=3347126 RepID=UPI00365F311C